MKVNGYIIKAHANLCGADLYNADLCGADLPHFNICPEVGGFFAWKKVESSTIKVYIPAKAKRTSSLIGRKCRAEFVKVISGAPTKLYTSRLNTEYLDGKTVYPDSYDDDIRLECTRGIHFFMTRKEAEEW